MDTVIPWRAMLRLNHNADTTIAVTVTELDTSVRSTTKVETDCENKSQTVSEALAICTNAHRSEIWRKNRRTCALPRTSWGSGQKSSASRPASGRLSGTDARNAIATNTVPSDGCRKYTNTLPDASAITVRAVSVTAPSTRTPGTRLRRVRRTRIAEYTQTRPTVI